MSDVLDATGYDKNSSEASGTGGRARQRTIDKYVSDAQGGGSKATSPNPESAPVPPKVHPAAYRATDQEKKTRTYGAPVGDVILK